MKHNIIVKFTQEAKSGDYPQLLAEIREIFGHCTAIPGVHAVRFLPNVIDRPNRYDLIISLDMEQEALEAYDNSEWHHQWKSGYGHLVEKKAIIDVED